MADAEDYKKRVLKEQDITFTTDYSKPYQWEAHAEDTADGFTIYYCRGKNETLEICDNIYHQESGLIERLQELIQDETGFTILLGDADFEEAIDWEELADDLDLIFEYEEESEIFELWKENVLPSVREEFEKNGVPDRPARSESFNNYTDGLCKDGKISEDMYNTICLPDHLETTNL